MVIDTEGYELIRIPWWYSLHTKKQVHFDTYSMLSYWREMTEADVIAFLRQRGFRGEEYLWLEGEYDRHELKERMGLFKVIPDKPVIIRRYIRRQYIPEELTTYTIVEKLKVLKVYLTFSIETGTGHQKPFFAEVTCDTTMPPELSELELNDRIRRVINGTLKLFFIVFDGNKIVKTSKKEHDPDWLVKTLFYLQKYADPIYEWRPLNEKEQRGGMDNFLKMMIDRITVRDPDEFVTKESLIAIGVEYESSVELQPEYPRVHAVIEKTRTGRWHVERDIILASATDVWLDKMLGMVISSGVPTEKT